MMNLKLINKETEIVIKDITSLFTTWNYEAKIDFTNKSIKIFVYTLQIYCKIADPFIKTLIDYDTWYMEWDNKHIALEFSVKKANTNSIILEARTNEFISCRDIRYTELGSDNDCGDCDSTM